MSNLLEQADTEPDIPMDDEPEIPLDHEPEIPIDLEPEPLVQSPEPQVAGVEAQVAPAALMQVLPADFPLPTLIKFVPNQQLRVAVNAAAAYAMSVDVRGAEGLQAADAALTVVRTSIRSIEEHFAEPADVANRLHKHLTGARADWIAQPKTVVETVGRRIYAERQRLQAIADEQRRKDQEEANRQVREEAAKRAEDAAKNQAPAAVVENLRQQAATAQAAPVAPPAAAPPTLAGSSPVKNWTCTILGTPRDADEQQPDISELNPDQLKKIQNLMLAVVAGDQPIGIFAIDWSYLNKRAKSDKAALSIPGIEAYDAGGTRAKPSRSK